MVSGYKLAVCRHELSCIRKAAVLSHMHVLVDSMSIVCPMCGGRADIHVYLCVEHLLFNAMGPFLIEFCRLVFHSMLLLSIHGVDPRPSIWTVGMSLGWGCLCGTCSLIRKFMHSNRSVTLEDVVMSFESEACHALICVSVLSSLAG